MGPSAELNPCSSYLLDNVKQPYCQLRHNGLIEMRQDLTRRETESLEFSGGVETGSMYVQGIQPNVPERITCNPILHTNVFIQF